MSTSSVLSNALATSIGWLSEIVYIPLGDLITDSLGSAPLFELYSDLG